VFSIVPTLKPADVNYKKRVKYYVMFVPGALMNLTRSGWIAGKQKVLECRDAKLVFVLTLQTESVLNDKKTQLQSGS
jgi:hypothetical protein